MNSFTYTNFDWDALLKKLPVKRNASDRALRRKMWKAIDMNDNGYASLAELDRGIQDVLNLPTIFKSKKVIMRAFQAAKKKYNARSKYSDDYVEWMEFRIFLVYLRQYFEYWVMFNRTDTDGDHKINLQEFKNAVPIMERWGVKIKNPVQEFKKIDTNGGGVIMFDEFCKYAIEKQLDLEDDDDFDDIELGKMK